MEKLKKNGNLLGLLYFVRIHETEVLGGTNDNTSHTRARAHTHIQTLASGDNCIGSTNVVPYIFGWKNNINFHGTPKKC